MVLAVGPTLRGGGCATAARCGATGCASMQHAYGFGLAGCGHRPSCCRQGRMLRWVPGMMRPGQTTWSRLPSCHSTPGICRFCPTPNCRCSAQRWRAHPVSIPRWGRRRRLLRHHPGCPDRRSQSICRRRRVLRVRHARASPSPAGTRVFTGGEAVRFTSVRLARAAKLLLMTWYRRNSGHKNREDFAYTRCCPSIGGVKAGFVLHDPAGTVGPAVTVFPRVATRLSPVSAVSGFSNWGKLQQMFVSQPMRWI